MIIVFIGHVPWHGVFDSKDLGRLLDFDPHYAWIRRLTFNIVCRRGSYLAGLQ